MRIGGRSRRARALALALVVASSAAAAQASAGEGGDVVVQALALLGTPYRYGGGTPSSGFDCSGLVRHVFASAADIALPRRSEEMEQVGRAVGRSELQPGDLVFFNTGGRPYSHVAIYIGQGRFVHAPTATGVVRIERLDQPYWSTRFDGARRLLAARAQSAVLSSATAPLPWDTDVIRP